jgi:hypothetical protein
MVVMVVLLAVIVPPLTGVAQAQQYKLVRGIEIDSGRTTQQGVVEIPVDFLIAKLAKGASAVGQCVTTRPGGNYSMTIFTTVKEKARSIAISFNDRRNGFGSAGRGNQTRFRRLPGVLDGMPTSDGKPYFERLPGVLDDQLGYDRRSTIGANRSIGSIGRNVSSRRENLGVGYDLANTDVKIRVLITADDGQSFEGTATAVIGQGFNGDVGIGGVSVNYANNGVSSDDAILKATEEVAKHLVKDIPEHESICPIDVKSGKNISAGTEIKFSRSGRGEIAAYEVISRHGDTVYVRALHEEYRPDTEDVFKIVSR